MSANVHTLPEELLQLCTDVLSVALLSNIIICYRGDGTLAVDSSMHHFIMSDTIVTILCHAHFSLLSP